MNNILNAICLKALAKSLSSLYNVRFSTRLNLDKADYDYVNHLQYKTFKCKINPSRLSVFRKVLN